MVSLLWVSGCECSGLMPCAFVPVQRAGGLPRETGRQSERQRHHEDNVPERTYALYTVDLIMLDT